MVLSWVIAKCELNERARKGLLVWRAGELVAEIIKGVDPWPRLSSGSLENRAKGMRHVPSEGSKVREKGNGTRSHHKIVSLLHEETQTASCMRGHLLYTALGHITSEQSPAERDEEVYLSPPGTWPKCALPRLTPPDLCDVSWPIQDVKQVYLTCGTMLHPSAGEEVVGAGRRLSIGFKQRDSTELRRAQAGSWWLQKWWRRKQQRAQELGEAGRIAGGTESVFNTGLRCSVNNCELVPSAWHFVDPQ